MTDTKPNMTSVWPAASYVHCFVIAYGLVSFYYLCHTSGPLTYLLLIPFTRWQNMTVMVKPR